MSAVVIIGTLDTKGREVAYARECLRRAGVDTILVDVGVLGEPETQPDICRRQVASAGGINLDQLVIEGDRGKAVDAMAVGARAVVAELHAAGRLGGVLALGGSAGASIATAAMRSLPIGVPKLIVSTVVCGDTRPYVGASDITMMYPIVDIAGLNRISKRIITNASAAMRGMLAAELVADTDNRPLVAATMFGVTTPCVMQAHARLDALGYEVMVFHATGAGGDSMEALVQDSYFDAILDLTTTELADELAGGICAAGPNRLNLRTQAHTPRVVSLGALDMVNFGPLETVPKRYRHRQLYRHNAAVTLMRTDAKECAELGRRLAAKLNQTTGPVALLLPRLGLSAIDAVGQPFFDPDADAALFESLLRDVEPDIEVHDLSLHINDPEFADAAAALVHQFATHG